MAIASESKIYKFKISDLKLTIIIDNTHTINSPKNIDETYFTDIELHYHAVYELFFVNSSPLTVYTDNGIIEYKNCIVCIPPFFKHRSCGNSINRFLFSFEQSGKSQSSFCNFISEFFSKEEPFEFNANTAIDFYIRQAAELFHSKNKLSDEITDSLFKLIFYHIYDSNIKSAEKDEIKTNESYLLKIDGIIHNYRDDINLQSFADALCLSTKQTSRIIKKNYKKSPSELITERRLEVACSLLKYTDKSISEIVEHINFSSETYFYYRFKKAYGCTPMEYKKQQALL